jgi:hypothetical protein
MPDKPTAPEYWSGKPEEHGRKTAQVVNQMMQGYGNNSFTVTLDATAATTEVIRTKCTSLQTAFLSPRNAAAASDFALGTTYAVTSEGKVTIHHATGVAGREYGVVLQG